MKLVTAVVKPYKLEAVRDGLSELGIQGMTVSEVKGFGRQKGHTELYRGAEYTIDFIPKMKIEIGINDDQLDDVVDSIVKSAGSGKIGDGKIFVVDLLDAVRIRTNDKGNAAL